MMITKETVTIFMMGMSTAFVLVVIASLIAYILLHGPKENGNHNE